MSLRQLRMLATVAETGSLSAAAQYLRLSQPAISQQIHALERHFGTPVVHRDRGTMALTPFGERLHAFAVETLQAHRDLQAAAREAEHDRGRRIVVAASSAVGEYLLPPLIGALRRRHPDLMIHIFVTTRWHVYQHVVQSEVALGIGVDVAENDQMACVHLCRMPVVGVARTDHPLARGPVRLAQVLDVPLILPPDGFNAQHRLTVLGRFRAAGMQPRAVALEISGNEATKRAVEQGVGVAFLAEPVVRAEVAAGRLAVIEIVDFDLCCQVQAFHLARRRLTPPARLFVDYVASRLAEVAGR